MYEREILDYYGFKEEYDTYKETNHFSTKLKI